MAEAKKVVHHAAIAVGSTNFQCKSVSFTPAGKESTAHPTQDGIGGVSSVHKEGMLSGTVLDNGDIDDQTIPQGVVLSGTYSNDINVQYAWTGWLAKPIEFSGSGEGVKVEIIVTSQKKL